MIALSDHQPLTPEEYLALEQTSEIKHEYIDGEIYAMAGGTGNHNLISSNLLILLKNGLRAAGCRTYISDMKVNVGDRRRFFYPDLVVTCDQRDEPQLSYIQFPTVIVEVLSPSTESFDRGASSSFTGKFPVCKSISSLMWINTWWNVFVAKKLISGFYKPIKV